MQEEIRQRVKEKKRQERRKQGVKLLICLGVLLLLLLIFWFAFRVRKVEIVGNEYYTEEQLHNMFITGIRDENTILLYLKMKGIRKGSIPFIEEIEVDYVDRHTVRIGVYEKVVTGCIKYMSHYVYFDKDGIVVETSPEPREGVPYITGLQMKSFTLYKTMDIEDQGLFDQILNLSQLIQKYKIKVDKIQFGVQKDVTLYSGEIEIPLGKRTMYDEQIAELSNLLPQAEGLSGVLDMKDYTPGQGRIILQEK